MSTFVLPTIAFWSKQLASTRSLTPFGYSWYDHLPPFYVQASTSSKQEAELDRHAPSLVGEERASRLEPRASRALRPSEAVELSRHPRTH